jgi:hypothetical protein
MRRAEGSALFQRLMDPAQHTPGKDPTLRAFAPRILHIHSRPRRQKPGGTASKQLILRVRVLPGWGHRSRDTIKNEDVQRLKSHLQTKSPTTVNNVLAVLSVMLKKGRRFGC